MEIDERKPAALDVRGMHAKHAARLKPGEIKRVRVRRRGGFSVPGCTGARGLRGFACCQSA
jgi:hypothetical protein